MQRITTLLFMISLLFGGYISAQVCTPDSSFTAPGIYPANLPSACINQAYDEVITVVVPQDTVVNIPPLGNVTVPIDSFVLINVKNLHPGLSFQCGNPSCGFPGNSIGCIRVSGIPTTMGTNVVKIITDVHVTLPIVGATAIRDSTFTLQFTVGAAMTASITTSTGDTTICGNDTLQLSGNGGFNSYVWSTGDTTQTIDVMSAGTYWVKAKSGGCQDSTAIIITPQTGPSITTAIMDATCGMANGSAAATATGVSPFTFTWSTGLMGTGTNSLLAGVSSGNYILTVEDANGCAADTIVSISDVGGASIDSSQVNHVTCNGAADGSISVFLSGGTTPYSFDWSNMASTQNLSNLGPGSYTLTLTDNSNCVTTFSANITEPATLDLNTIFQSDPLCYGGMNGSANVLASGGTTPYTYSWSGGGSGDMNNMLAAGMHSAYVTDGNNCKDTVSVTISQPDSLDIMASVIDPDCFGATGEIGLTVSGGAGGFTYQWTVFPAQTGATATNLIADTYSCTVTDMNGCVKTYTGTLTEPPLLVSVDSAQNTISGQSNGRAWVDVSGGTPPYTYSWSNGGMTDTISNLPAGNYPVTITDAKGCTAIDTAMVGEDPNGIEDEIAAGISSWELFPNPTSSQVMIQLKLDRVQPIKVSLFDMNGRLLAEQSAQAQNWEGSFDLTEQTAGLYLLRVTTAQGASGRRIIKR